LNLGPYEYEAGVLNYSTITRGTFSEPSTHDILALGKLSDFRAFQIRDTDMYREEIV
jgi:hypothetical protein